MQGTGAKIQIAIGGFSFQPEEFAKLALAVFFASYLVTKRDVLALAGRRVLGIDLPRARDLGPVLIAWAASLLLLVFETDIGTSALFFGMFVAMIYIATQRTSWLLIGLGCSWPARSRPASCSATSASGSTSGCTRSPAATRTVPPTSWCRACTGWASAASWARGLGHGQPYFTPLVQSDFIITAFGEELGLTGLMAHPDHLRR